MVIQALGQKGWRHPNKLELAWQHSRVACFAVGFCAMRGWGEIYGIVIIPWKKLVWPEGG